jgi:hypothetical protein
MCIINLLGILSFAQKPYTRRKKSVLCVCRREGKAKEKNGNIDSLARKIFSYGTPPLRFMHTQRASEKKKERRERA